MDRDWLGAVMQAWLDDLQAAEIPDRDEWLEENYGR